MKKVVGIATMKGRERSLEISINSLIKQVDEIFIYDNRYMPNKADNGKFYGLTQINEPCYYFTCDDDLRYNVDYIENMIEGIELTKSIVTHHGRILRGADVSYYRGHDSIRCTDENFRLVKIDVCGTGVTGFRTDYFNPTELHNAKDLRMSDLVFSLEAMKQGKTIVSLPHRKGYIQQLSIDFRKSIASMESKNETRQIEIANEIWRLKNLK